jgi:hypothetical protein
VFCRWHTHQSTRSIFGFKGCREQLFEMVRMIRSFPYKMTA